MVERKFNVFLMEWPVSIAICKKSIITHSVIFRKFPQKCAPSVDWFKPIRERLQKNKKVKANAQGYSHLPTHLMVPTYRSNTNLFKKISLGTQIFIFCQIWVIENSTMSSKQILIGQLWTREGANIQKITQCDTRPIFFNILWSVIRI